jgi:hypothetical protein
MQITTPAGHCLDLTPEALETIHAAGMGRAVGGYLDRGDTVDEDIEVMRMNGSRDDLIAACLDGVDADDRDTIACWHEYVAEVVACAERIA